MKQLKYVFMMFVSCISKAPCEEGIMSCVSGIFGHNARHNTEHPPAGVHRFTTKLTIASGEVGQLGFRTPEECVDMLLTKPEDVFNNAAKGRIVIPNRQKPIYLIGTQKITHPEHAQLLYNGCTLTAVLTSRFCPENLRLIIRDTRVPITEMELDFYNPGERFSHFYDASRARAAELGDKFIRLEIYVLDVHSGIGSTVAFVHHDLDCPEKRHQFIAFLDNPDNHGSIETVLEQGFSARSVKIGLKTMFLRSMLPWISRVFHVSSTQEYRSLVFDHFGLNQESIDKLDAFYKALQKVR